MIHLQYTTESIELQDYYYVLKRQTISRYEGSKTTSVKYNDYTSVSSSVTFLNGEVGTWTGDKSFGKTAAIDIETPYFVYFTTASNAGPEKPKYSNLNVGYLINAETEETLALTSLGENYEILANIFRPGDDIEVANTSNNNLIYKKRVLYNVGLYKTIFTTSGSDWPSGSFLSGYLNAFFISPSWISGSYSGSYFTNTPYIANLSQPSNGVEGWLEFSSSLFNLFDYNPDNPTFTIPTSFSPLTTSSFNIDSLTTYGGTAEYDLFPIQSGDYFRFLPNYTLFSQSLYPEDDYINFYRTFDSQLTSISGAYQSTFSGPGNVMIKRYSFVPIENPANNFSQLMYNLMSFSTASWFSNILNSDIKLDFRVYRKLNIETNLVIKKPNIQGSGIVLPKYFPKRYKKNIPNLLKKLNII